MPLIKSAKKALRQSIANKVYNDATRAKVKNAVKGTRIAAKTGAADAAAKLSAAYRELDLAAKKHVIHKNKAARLKSRLSKVLKTAEITPVKVKSVKKKIAKKK